MFNENDLTAFWFSRKGYTILINQATSLERLNRRRYGFNSPVPMVFFDSHDKSGKPNIISKTPFGKVIFPGPLMTSHIETGVLYRDLKLLHDSNYCITAGKDYRTDAYWREVLNGRKIEAIKKFRSLSGYGLKEAKDIVDKDWPIVWGTNLAGVNPSSTPSNSHDPLNPFNQRSPSDYQKKIDDAVNSARHYIIENQRLERRMYKLEDELAQALNDLADETEKNLQPQAVSSIGNLNINIWDIIECSPNDNHETIKSSIKTAIRLYHPDKVNNCGPVLQEISKEITTQLLLFRKQLRR